MLDKKVDRSISDIYYGRQELIIDDNLIIKSNYVNGNNYHYSFKLEFDNIHFGYIHLCNTKQITIAKVEIDNRILYEKPIIYVLSRLLHIAIVFNLKFNNISVLEVARDTSTQVYESLSMVYYQSTKCNNTVHKLSGNNPRYKPVTKVKIHDFPDENGCTGTFTIGVNTSEAFVKVYCKTPEITGNDFKKEYIRELHLKHFGASENINRVEVTLSTNAFGKNGIMWQFNHDLSMVLNPRNFPHIFFRALGEVNF